MIKIDPSLLAEVGLADLPEEEGNVLLSYIYETLEERVGVNLADRMTPAQLDEFEVYFEAKDDDGAFKWLAANFPDYREIVQHEFKVLLRELREVAPLMLGFAGGSQ